MKKICIVAATAVILISMAGFSWAATTALTNNSISVTATVHPVCTEATAATFAAMDIQPLNGDVVATASPDESVYCSQGGLYTVKISSTNASGGATAVACDNAGANSVTQGFRMYDGTNYLSYEFACAGLNGSGQFNGGGYTVAKSFGAAVTVRSAVAAAAAASAGYTDTVTLTVEY